MSEKRKLVIATHNENKLTEIIFLLGSMNIDIIGLDKFPDITDIEETGSTLRENSLIKAKTVNKITGLPCLADDTGLEVKALGGAPGVYTARYAGHNATFNENVSKLLKKLNGIPSKKRKARFKTIVCLYDGDYEVYAEGIINGIISLRPKGKGGFGYDSVFIPDSYTRTFAELNLEEKNRISHRARAVNEIKMKLHSYFSKESI